MAFSVLKSTSGTQESANKVEILIDAANDLNTLPTEYAPGSIAYTADLSQMYMKSLDGTWTRIGG